MEKSAHHILLLFLDGVGIGKNDYDVNPFFKFGFKTFEKIFGETPHLENQSLSNGKIFLSPVDALMGIKGLPQSGTGQTSIFCGVKAPQIINQHFGPFPYSTLIPIIRKENIFKYFFDKNEGVVFANAYPQIFFDYIDSGKKRLSVTTLSCNLNGMHLNGYDDVAAGNALTAEITNARWNTKLGYDLPVISPQHAAENLLNIACKNSFTAFEYFLTDHLGHGRYDEDTASTLNTLDEFLYTLFTQFDHETLSIILCSDHGNVEDLSVKTHTNNPALLITAGCKAKIISESISDLSDIKNAIIKNLC
ncbi:MAG: metalloenzyme [Ignavibacteria bacterium CG_4_8_14_3_um_filter_37_9]|nr:metalloenzyme [Ignavibacteria bacterium]OIO13893.1 MAG: metalloenzyme [Ignavibacteria bacterium CG1_02_37_35]PIS45251.1 MAG: metalloenzyme [Ignavibacteria bacterium CG08_land_8_20_14_0_20_37_9]PIX00139.1 MAG: metalloenzyme [Ignavibacteria bacterium CG_4_8_14_3_um_filter_37_9]PIX94492.1 MAG: metalloenzyme [Ignavibacteria bacterium CG_4_10_14_3_um_filter_37_18]PJC59971.1 MAG: metalloenzyme [Ignavibacteria bacterium CG_4_9_14_0_2_um_filter_37_13]